MAEKVENQSGDAPLQVHVPDQVLRSAFALGAILHGRALDRLATE